MEQGATASQLSNNPWEFPRNRVDLQVVLGSGAFGLVMKAQAQGIKGCVGKMYVAVKIVKGKYFTRRYFDTMRTVVFNLKVRLIFDLKSMPEPINQTILADEGRVINELCGHGMRAIILYSRTVRLPHLPCFPTRTCFNMGNDVL